MSPLSQIAAKGSPGDTQNEALGSLGPPLGLSGCTCDRFGRERVALRHTFAHQDAFKAETGPNQAPKKDRGGTGGASPPGREFARLALRGGFSCGENHNSAEAQFCSL